MAYIGRSPSVGAYKVCDAISTSATDTFNLLVGGVATSPETANNCIVSLNGVVQAPGASGGFTVSGSTIVFNSALTTADVIDFIYILGDTMSIGTPSDDTVTLAKMASGTDGNIISYDASGNPVAVATGNDGQVLTSAGAGQPPAFEAAGGGKVLQVVSNTWNDTTSGTSSTFALVTGSGTSITPSATSSKILIVGFVSCDHSGDSQIRFKLYDSTSEITGASGSGGSGYNVTVGHTGHNYGTAGVNALPYVHLYSPSTTSAVTINLYFASSSTGWVNANHGSDAQRFISNTTLYEIGT
jgi:hypothetical protein